MRPCLKKKKQGRKPLASAHIHTHACVPTYTYAPSHTWPDHGVLQKPTRKPSPVCKSQEPLFKLKLGRSIRLTQQLRAERPKLSWGRVFIIVEVGVRGFPGFRTLIGWYLSRGLGKRRKGESRAQGHWWSYLILSNGWNVWYFPLDAGPPWVVSAFCFFFSPRNPVLPTMAAVLPGLHMAWVPLRVTRLPWVSHVWPGCPGPHNEHLYTQDHTCTPTCTFTLHSDLIY